MKFLISFLMMFSINSVYALDSGLLKEANKAINVVKAADPNLGGVFSSAHAYAVLPDVGQGGFIVSGMHGKGIVFKGGSAIGQTEMKQASVGMSIGGKSFIEVVFFQNASSLKKFIAGDVKFTANSSLYNIVKGKPKKIKYKDGMAVVTLGKGGVMLDTSIGGQDFDYEAK